MERNWREEQNQLHWDLIWYFAEMSVDWSDGTSVLLQQYPPEVLRENYSDEDQQAKHGVKYFVNIFNN